MRSTSGSPSFPTATLAIVAGLLAGLNQVVFPFGSHNATWHSAITLALYFFGVMGVAPLVGPAFRNAIHLPPSVALLLTALLGTLGLAVTTFGLSHEVKGIIEGLLTFFATLGFGALPTPISDAPAVAPPA